jgi:hypothetical protein
MMKYPLMNYTKSLHRFVKTTLGYGGQTVINHTITIQLSCLKLSASDLLTNHTQEY